MTITRTRKMMSSVMTTEMIESMESESRDEESGDDTIVQRWPT